MATDDYCLIKSKVTFIWKIFSKLFLVTVQYIILTVLYKKQYFVSTLSNWGGGTLQKLLGDVH